MNDDLLARQELVKLVALMENVAYLLRKGESREEIAAVLDLAAEELRTDLDRGHV
jgi:hypothetical protein